MSNEATEVEELLDRAYESEDEAEIAELVNRALEIEPDNPEALLLRADMTDDDEERLSILTGAVDAVRTVLNGMDKPDEDLESVYMALTQRLAFTLFSVGDDEAALPLAEELISRDIDDGGTSKSLYYRILIERQEWARILDETRDDTDHQLGWAYARMAALFMTGDRKAAASMFWDALIMAPNVPFYMLGYMPEPGSDGQDVLVSASAQGGARLTQTDGEDDEDFNFACLYEDVWSLSRDMLNWFSRGVILFGLLSGRLNSDRDSMLEILDSLGGRAEYEKMSGIIRDSDDETIIETLAAHRCLVDSVD